MATTSSLKWYGEQLVAKITGTTEAGLWEAGNELLEDAKSRAPKVTGTLRDSGYVATSERSTYSDDDQHTKERKVPEGAALVGFAAFYSHMVEGGTSKMAARPFLRPALDSQRPQLGKKIVIVMASELRKR